MKEKKFSESDEINRGSRWEFVMRVVKVFAEKTGIHGKTSKI